MGSLHTVITGHLAHILTGRSALALPNWVNYTEAAEEKSAVRVPQASAEIQVRKKMHSLSMPATVIKGRMRK